MGHNLSKSSKESQSPPNSTTHQQIPKIHLVIDADTDDNFGLLLCGRVDSGRTTFMRQLQLKFLKNIDQSDISFYVNAIKGQLVESIQLLSFWLEKQEKQVTKKNEEVLERIKVLEPYECNFTPEIFNDLKLLWKDPQIQEAFAHKDETAIPDHIDYFFDKIDEIAATDYLPSNDDILRARIRTVGIDKLTFSVNGANTTIYDIGSQKNDKSKWSNIYDISHGFIYCFALSDFNKALDENSKKSQLDDSLETFSLLVHNPKLQDFPFFFIGTKMDLFTKKIKNTNVFGQSFPDYKGDIHNPEECANYIIQKFLEVAKPDSATRPIMTYKISVMNQDEVISVIADICQYIADHYFD